LEDLKAKWFGKTEEEINHGDSLASLLWDKKKN